MRRIIQLILHYLYRPLLELYLNRNLTWRYKGLDMFIKKGVFHPAFFGSTKVFADFLERQELNGKSLLEVGCGSGILSLLSAKWGANVTALDINPDAVETTRLNAESNGLPVDLLQSDIFQNLPHRPFDIIINNPPYFPAEAQNDAEHAWYCGPDFGFFQRFFIGLKDFTQPQTRVWMILSDECKLDRIAEIAGKQGLELKEIHKAKSLLETFVVLEIMRNG